MVVKMTLVDQEAFTATSLGFPPYKRSYLPSKTSQAFLHIFSSGQNAQEKQESLGGQLFDERNVVEDGEGGGLQEEKDLVDNADVEEGEISEGMVETNMSDHQVDDPEQHIQKDNQVEQEDRDENGFSLVGKANSRYSLSPRQLKENKSVLGCRKTCKVKQIDAFDLMRDAILSRNDVHKTKGSSKSDSLKHTGPILESVVIKNEGKAATAKVYEKRVITEERKAKKKATRRRKRAEEDKKSGVKRLKLQLMSKPKEVVYCKYYINGKCQQGDACKFSHDITPLTKSKPCNFFALHQCLKGKDCPYDHDLFKYPCNNFKATGFCSRGDACLFSHKIPLTNDSPASDCNKIAADSGKQPAKGSNSQQALNISANMTPRTPSSLETINRFPGKSVVEMKTPAQAPKGISFLSFGKASSETPSTQQKHDLPAIRDNGAAIGSIHQGTSEKFKNFSEKSGKVLVTTQSLSQPPKRTVGGKTNSIFNSVPRESSPTFQVASKWANPVADPVHEASATARPVAGEQNKNIINSALKEPSSTCQFALKWGNSVANTVHEAPIAAGPVAGGMNKKTFNSSPREPSLASQFTSKWGNQVANKAPATAVPVAGGQNKNIFNSALREPSLTSQFASKRANPVANPVHVAPSIAGPVAASKFKSEVMGRSVQSTAPNIPTVSGILQELLFNGH